MAETNDNLHFYLVSGMSAHGYHNIEIGMATKDIKGDDLKYFKEKLQTNAKKHFGEQVNVVVMNIIYLGYMTINEFYNKGENNE